jgi:hypothetical protein
MNLERKYKLILIYAAVFEEQKLPLQLSVDIIVGYR